MLNLIHLQNKKHMCKAKSSDNDFKYVDSNTTYSVVPLIAIVPVYSHFSYRRALWTANIAIQSDLLLFSAPDCECRV